MDTDELRVCSLRNRLTFERVIGPYVQVKVSQAVRQREKDAGRRMAREGWLDASGCVWCVFDSPSFMRSGSAARALRDDAGSGFDLQVYWSVEDVVMPHECSERWVAERIADEAERQLSELGYACRVEERHVEGDVHLGVRFW
ncbi:MAG: hypothetical protein QM302_04540 [Acidobacteriota bacterium]|nr:hypothetical protein [Acidobacteriota bacterium]